MSQSGILNTSGGSGPGSGVLTITGNDAIAVSPDGGGNITLIGAGNISVTNTAANTLKIIDANTVEYFTTTNDATPDAIITIPVASFTVVTVIATVAGAKSDWTLGLWGEVIAGARRAGAGASLIQIPTATFGTDSTLGAAITAAVVGNDLVIQVIGVAAQTWNWTATFRVVVQT